MALICAIGAITYFAWLFVIDLGIRIVLLDYFVGAPVHLTLAMQLAYFSQWILAAASLFLALSVFVSQIPLRTMASVWFLVFSAFYIIGLAAYPAVLRWPIAVPVFFAGLGLLKWVRRLTKRAA